MGGGTLVVSRAINNFTQYKEELTKRGFHNVVCTSAESDELNSIIRKMNPDLMIIGARFYQRSTPFMMKELLKIFPKLKIAAVSLDEYPPELAMYFIRNGVKSYAAYFDGVNELMKGLAEIRDGRIYISPIVEERIDKRDAEIEPAGEITDHLMEIICNICNGFKDIEIAEMLHITRRTVTTHKTEIFRTLNVRNSNELMRVVDELGFMEKHGMFFYPKKFVLNPLPEEMKFKRRKDKK